MLARRVGSRLLRGIASSSSPTSSTSIPATTESAPAAAPQAPNYATPWSTNQRPRPAAGSNPRFEQTAMELQPNPLSAMKLIAGESVRQVHGRKAVCDGGGGMSVFRDFSTKFMVDRSSGASQDIHQSCKCLALSGTIVDCSRRTRRVPALAGTFFMIFYCHDLISFRYW